MQGVSPGVIFYEVMRRGAFRLGFGMSAGGLPVLAAPAAWEGPVFVEISAGPVHPGQQATSSLRRGVRKNSLTLDVASPLIQIRTVF